MEKDKKRELREKNDTILKMFVLSDTMHLTNEEFGALVRIVMIEDDRKDKRYEGMKGFVLNEFKKKEQEWTKSFEQLTENNKTLISAFSTVFGQANKSHNSFLNLSKQYNNDDKNSNGTQGNSEGTGDSKTNTDTGTPTGTETPTESDLEGEEWITKTLKIYNEIENKDEYYMLEFRKKNENNIPTDDEMNMINYYDILKILEAGTLDNWSMKWKTYIGIEEELGEGETK